MKRHIARHMINFADCDPAQIVYYPRFFDLFDRATEMMFRSVDLHWERMHAETDYAGMPLVEVSAKFLAPVRFGDEIELETWIEEWRNRSFIVLHKVMRGETVAAEGREVRIWSVGDLDRPEGIRAAPIPEDVKARFAD